MTGAYDGREVVGMDLHRRRSVLARMTPDGRKLETMQITNSPEELRRQIARAGVSPQVAVETTYAWYGLHLAENVRKSFEKGIYPTEDMRWISM